MGIPGLQGFFHSTCISFPLWPISKHNLAANWAQNLWSLVPGNVISSDYKMDVVAPLDQGFSYFGHGNEVAQIRGAATDNFKVLGLNYSLFQIEWRIWSCPYHILNRY